MIGIPPSPEQRQIIACWRQLGDEERRSLLLFAEFLLQRQESVVRAPSPPVPSQPLEILPPEHESAVHALKRLKKSYPMIEADTALLDHAAQLLMQKVLGTPDSEVILRMEELFAERYRQWQKGGK